MRIKTTVTEAKKEDAHNENNINNIKKQQQENKWNREKSAHTHETMEIGDELEWTKCVLHFYQEQQFSIEMHAAERKTSASFR